MAYTNLTQVGALTSGSITSFGTIATGNTISGTTLTATGLSSAGIVTNTAGGLLGTVATIPVANGGTNIASYSIGDLLYASAGTTLSKLSDIATGNCLISGGIGVAPSWGSCAGSTGAIIQAPTLTSTNTITPITTNVVGLTVNGTSGATPATAVSIVQGGAADALAISSTGSNTATNGIDLSGTFTGELINSANFKVTSAGQITLAGGLSPDITTAAAGTANKLTIQPGSSNSATSTGGNLVLQAGNDTGATSATGGSVSILGGTATVGTTTTGGSVSIDAGTGTTANGTINIGGTNDAPVVIGKSSGTSNLTLGSSSAAQQVLIANGAGATTVATYQCQHWLAATSP